MLSGQRYYKIPVPVPVEFRVEFPSLSVEAGVVLRNPLNLSSLLMG